MIALDALTAMRAQRHQAEPCTCPSREGYRWQSLGPSVDAHDLSSDSGRSLVLRHLISFERSSRSPEEKGGRLTDLEKKMLAPRRLDRCSGATPLGESLACFKNRQGCTCTSLHLLKALYICEGQRTRPQTYTLCIKESWNANRKDRRMLIHHALRLCDGGTGTDVSVFRCASVRQLKSWMARQCSEGRKAAKLNCSV